jgi:hypothetical protein
MKFLTLSNFFQTRVSESYFTKYTAIFWRAEALCEEVISCHMTSFLMPLTVKWFWFS